ncbi:hypothetical protein BGX31_010124 [Mortierella sp. GBA43]|nr:hypothetical protein BGX31_010124 [Mortierella sp. GBA43]
MSVLPPPPPPPLPASEAGAPPPPSSTHSTVYVGHLSARTERRDVEELFEKYGRLVSVELKHGGFAFVEYEDPRDAEDSVNKLNGYELDGNRISVEWSRRSGGPGSGCFLCNQPGHWARECPEAREKGMDVKSGKCFKCGEPATKPEMESRMKISKAFNTNPSLLSPIEVLTLRDVTQQEEREERHLIMITVVDLHLLLAMEAAVVDLLLPMGETLTTILTVDAVFPGLLNVDMEGQADFVVALLTVQATVVARLLLTIAILDAVVRQAHTDSTRRKRLLRIL